MNTPDNVVYRGERLTGERGEAIGVLVARNDEQFSPAKVLRGVATAPSGFEWGYTGAGPNALALALLLDVTGDKERARRAQVWFMWAVVNCWGDCWQITSTQIEEWIQAFEREDRWHKGEHGSQPAEDDAGCDEDAAEVAIFAAMEGGAP